MVLLVDVFFSISLFYFLLLRTLAWSWPLSLLFFFWGDGRFCVVVVNFH
nr:MAG TPA: hypothetical protein [Caudoviricetes sp.]